MLHQLRRQRPPVGRRRRVGGHGRVAQGVLEAAEVRQVGEGGGWGFLGRLALGDGECL